MRDLVCCALLAVASVLVPCELALASDPTTADCLAANEKSIALRNKHKLRAARSELLVCASTSCPEDIRNECMRRVAETNAQIPTIVFEIKDHENNDLSAVSVTMDGQLLVDHLDGTAFSIDPGEHLFVFSVADVSPVLKRLVIREGEKNRREKIVLGPQAAPSGVVGPTPNAPPVAQSAPLIQQGSPAASSGDGPRVAGYVVGGAGVVGLGVALYEQIMAKDRDSSSRRAARSEDPAVRATTHAIYEQAEQAQTYAVIIGAVSAAAVGVGLYLVLSSSSDEGPHDSSAQLLVPALSAHGGGVTYLSAF